MKLLLKVVAGTTCLQQRLFVSEKMAYNIHFLMSASLFWVLCSCYYRLFFSLFFDSVISKYEKLDYRTRKLFTDIEFLNNCRNHDLCEAFFKYKMISKRLQPSDAYKLSQRVFIHYEIAFKTLENNKVCAQSTKMKDDFWIVVSFFDWSNIGNTWTATLSVKEVQDYTRIVGINTNS